MKRTRSKKSRDTVPLKYIYIFIDARRPAFLGFFLYFTYIRYIEGHGCTLPDQNTLDIYDSSGAHNSSK